MNQKLSWSVFGASEERSVMTSFPLRLLWVAVLSSGVLVAALAHAKDLPEPPIPPDSALPDDAPLPHKDAALPAVAANQAVSVTPENFRTLSKRSDPAAGFVPGSQYENTTEQKGIQTLGILVRVPLSPVK